MSNLKPCPFCGEKEDISYEFGGSQGYMRCLSCDTYGPSGENEADPEWDGDAAYEAWNKRATKSEAEQDKREEVEQQLAKANETIAALSLETDNAITMQAERNQLKRDLAKANERTAILEQCVIKFRQGVTHFNRTRGDLNVLLSAYADCEQLRKEQGSD